jgi:hypothetical protein
MSFNLLQTRFGQLRGGNPKRDTTVLVAIEENMRDKERPNWRFHQAAEAARAYLEVLYGLKTVPEGSEERDALEG